MCRMLWVVTAALGVGLAACGGDGPHDGVNTPPSVSQITPVGNARGVITIGYRLVDAESSRASVVVEYSMDDGLTFAAATPAATGDGPSGLSSSPSGVAHTFTWDSAADCVGVRSPAPSVLIRMSAADSMPGRPAISAAFSVTNRPRAYKLTPVRVTGVPAGDATGIATDQTHFWVVAGGHNALDHALLYFDPDTQRVMKSFAFHNLIGQLGTGVYGMTWDGASVWLSVSGNVNKLVQIDVETGTITKTLSSPTTLGPSDLDWDGDRLWLSSGVGKIHSVDPVNGEARDVGAFGDRDSGIAVREDEVWVGALFSGDVRVLDKATGELIMLMPGVLQETPRSLAFHQGQLVALGPSGLVFHRIALVCRSSAGR